jgi:hypothetical protein
MATINNTPVVKSPEVPDGIFTLVLAKHTEVDNKFQPGKKQRAFFYTILERESEGMFCWFTSLERGPKINDVMAAHGVEVSADGETEVSLDALIGQTVRGVVQKKAKEGDTTGKKYSRLTSLLAKVA